MTERASVLRRWALVAAAVLATGCGLGGTPPNGVAATPSSGPVTLRWFLRWDQARIERVARPMVAAFHARHPNITIQIENQPVLGDYWTKLQTELAGATAPDVIYPNTQEAGALATKSALLDLDPYVSRDRVDTSRYEPATLGYYRSRGHLYGLPIDSARLAVFYNRDMFDAAHVAYPRAGWSWDDFVGDTRALARTVHGQRQYGSASWVVGGPTGPGYWPLLVWDYAGHDVLDDPHKPTRFLLGDPMAVQWLQRIADLMNKDHAMPTPAEAAGIEDLFLADKAAMIVTGHWRVPQYLASAKFRWGVAPLPGGRVLANRSDGSAWAIPAQSKHPAEAWEFIKFLDAPDAPGVKLLLGLQQMTPALVDAQSSPDYLTTPSGAPGLDQRAFLAGSDHLYTLYDPLLPSWNQIDDVEDTALDQLWAGKITAAQAVQQMQPQIQSALKGSGS